MGRLVGGSPGLSLRRQPLQFLGISLPLISTLLIGTDIVVGSYDAEVAEGRAKQGLGERDYWGTQSISVPLYSRKTSLS